MHPGGTKDPLWNMVPPDILKQVLERLPFRDALTCRSLSSCWASAVQASVPVEFVIPAKPQNLEGKMRRLQKKTSTSQSSCSLPGHWICTFKLMGRISVQKCSGLLGSLTQLGKLETSCQVLIQLLAPDPARLHTLQQRLTTIVEATAQLASNSINICISMDASRQGTLTSPEALTKLVPVIQHLNFMPTRPADVIFHHAVSVSHISALLPSKNCIRSLSLSMLLPGFPLALIANLCDLQRLELHLDDADGLRYLSALKRLEELHVKFPDQGPDGIAIGGVLNSNLDSLLHVALTAKSWDDETYMALSCMYKLRTCTLHVVHLQQGIGEVLARVRAVQSLSVTITRVDMCLSSDLWDMTSCNAYITDLTLHGGPAMAVSSLGSLQHLSSLTLCGVDLIGSHFQPQPRIEKLTIHDGRMGNAELEDIVQSYPCLKHLELSCCMHITPDTVCIISCLRHLATLCLSHLVGLCDASLRLMEAFLRAQQALGMAQPNIHFSCKWGNQVRESCIDYMRYPVLGGADFDEQRPPLTERCWVEVVSPRTSFLVETALLVLQNSPFVSQALGTWLINKWGHRCRQIWLSTVPRLREVSKSI